MKAILFSAGFGTRLKPWTLDKAKPAIDFLGLPMMAYPIYFLKTVSDHLVINTHHLPETIKSAFNSLNTDLSTEFTFESPKILESGGTIKSLQTRLQNENHFITANADCLLVTKDSDFLKDMLLKHKESKAIASLLTVDLKGIGKDISAAWVDNNNNIIEFGKNKNQGTPLHYAGIMIVSKEIFNYLPNGISNILLDGLIPAIRNGETVKAYHRSDITWFETGTIDEFKKNEELYKKNEDLKKIRQYYSNNK